jgi:hypothetical protein
MTFPLPLPAKDRNVSVVDRAPQDSRPANTEEAVKIARDTMERRAAHRAIAPNACAIDYPTVSR